MLLSSQSILQERLSETKINSLLSSNEISEVSEFINNLPKNLSSIFSEFTSYGFKIRVVGGAVRDILLGDYPRDIDLITNAIPYYTIWMLNNMDDMEVVVRGIKHGTVIAIPSPNEEYEITSLDFKVYDQDGRIKVAHKDSFKADALRRDFTINSLSIDTEGVLHDYCGGFNDLKNQVIRFIGNYEQRISQDPILGWRFFKMISKFPNPKYNKNVINYISENRNTIKDSISDYRIKQDIKGIQSGASGDLAMKYLIDLGFVREEDIV